MMKVEFCKYGSCSVQVLAQSKLLYIASSISLVVPLKFRFELFKNAEILVNATWHKCHKTCIKLHHICCYADCHFDESEVCEYGSCSVQVLTQSKLMYIASSMSLIVPLEFRFDLFKNGEVEKIATWHKCYKTFICCH